MWTGNMQERILYEDDAIIVCHKPSGIAVQSAGVGQMDLESALRNYLAGKKQNAEGIPYLAVIHRLDQPVEGVMVFAKTPRAAKELNRQISAKEITKEYLAAVSVRPESDRGALEDYLLKDGKSNTSRVVPKGTPGAKPASLQYALERVSGIGVEGTRYFVVRIRLETGRHHQIRVQMAHAGMPLVGDRKYNPGDMSGETLGLCAVKLEFRHPVHKGAMCMTINPENRIFA
ncbi:MAG: RluA family pseudouridine synthase [Blautia sp.]|nr:RluA family pseudouridine synthase [Blautia sp.]